MGDQIGQAVDGTLYYLPYPELERVRTSTLPREQRATLLADMCRLNALYMTSIFVGGAIGSALASPVYERFGWSGTALLAAGLPLLALLAFIGKEE